MERFGSIQSEELMASAMAGLETGVLAALGMLAYHMLGSIVGGVGIWEHLERLSAAVFGRQIYQASQALAASSGAALLVFWGGAMGAAFALGSRGKWAAQRLFLLGPLAALLWYYLAYEVWLPRFGRGAYWVAPRRTLVLGHLIFGLLLSLYPRVLRRLRAG